MKAVAIALGFAATAAASGNLFLADMRDTDFVLPHSWQASGFCPPAPHETESENYFLSEDMFQNLIYTSSTPLTRGSPTDPALGFAPGVAASGPWQIRPHWALDLVTVIDPATGVSAPPVVQGENETDSSFLARRTATGEALTERVIKQLLHQKDPGTVHMMKSVEMGATTTSVCDASNLPAPALNTSLLETFISRLSVDLGMRAGFEIMGWPSSMTTNVTDATQACLWSGMVAQTLKAVVSAAGGADVVRQFRLEGWNEVRLNGDFDGVDVSIPVGINNLWDATAAAVDSVLGRATSTLGTHSISRWGPMGQEMLTHISNGTSVLFGDSWEVRRGDFIPIHAKGDATAFKVMPKEVNYVAELLSAQPEIVRVDGSSAPAPGTKPWAAPYVNDESDPLVEWDNTVDWRGDARYPAMMTKVVAQALNDWINPNASRPGLPPYPGPGDSPIGPKGIPFGYLAFDAAFMNVGPTDFFSFRSFTTRFMMNHTTPRGVETIRKLSLNVMAPLALLGDRQLPVVSPAASRASAAVEEDPPVWPPAPANVSAIVSHRSAAAGAPHTSNEIAVAVYASQGAVSTTGVNTTFCVQIGNANTITQGASPRAAIYAVHDRPSDPASVWEAAGSPPFPSNDLLASMRAGGEIAPVDIGPIDALGDTLFFNTSSEGVPATGVYVMHACAQPAAPPPAPPAAPFVHRSTLNAAEVFVKWSDSGARCLATYVVEVTTDGGLTWTSSTNGTASVSLVWLHQDTNPPSAVQFRVRAVDYWGRYGAWSPTSQRI